VRISARILSNFSGRTAQIFLMTKSEWIVNIFVGLTADSFGKMPSTQSRGSISIRSWPLKFEGELDEHYILHLFVEAVWRDDQGRPSL
jgi:hypothetical protein